MPKCILSGFTSKGNVRLRNEDSILINSEVLNDEKQYFKKLNLDKNVYIKLAIADGMGGHSDGHIASKVAIEYIKEESFENLGKQTFQNINERFLELNRGSFTTKAMGTTLTLIKISNNKVECFSVGDTPAFVIKNNSCLVLNKLDNFSDKHGIKSSMITNCLGANTLNKELKIHSNIISLLSLESILICSDGVSNFINEQDIIELSNKTNSENLAQEIVSKAIDAGSDDNASVVIVRFNKGE